MRDLIFKDFWLKLFSLMLAVLIWLTVSFAIQRESTNPLNKQGKNAASADDNPSSNNSADRPANNANAPPR
jgi:hypothetical protein